MEQEQGDVKGKMDEEDCEMDDADAECGAKEPEEGYGARHLVGSEANDGHSNSENSVEQEIEEEEDEEEPLEKRVEDEEMATGH